MELPKIGQRVKLYPAPLPRHPDDDGEPVFRRVSDGPGIDGARPRFLPEAGAERPFDYYWHDRYMAGDVLLTDPHVSYQHAARITELQPRELAPGEQLEEAPLPAGATAVQLPPGSDSEKRAARAPRGARATQSVPTEAVTPGGPAATATLDNTQSVKE